jgi:hypothetical protein
MRSDSSRLREDDWATASAAIVCRVPLPWLPGKKRNVSQRSRMRLRYIKSARSLYLYQVNDTQSDARFNLRPLRLGATLVGMLCLLYGFIWDSD